jgi:hypothetical protein
MKATFPRDYVFERRAEEKEANCEVIARLDDDFGVERKY